MAFMNSSVDSEAVSRFAPDAPLLGDYADVLAMVQGQRLAGEPEKLIALALKVDPRNLKALALAGSAAFETKDLCLNSRRSLSLHAFQDRSAAPQPGDRKGVSAPVSNDASSVTVIINSEVR